MCKNFMVIRHSIKELLAKSTITRPMKCIVALHLLKRMQRKLTLIIVDVQNKILSETDIAFYDKNNQFADALKRHTLYLNNVSVSLSSKLVKTCILLCGIDLQGLYIQNEKGQSEITAENNTEALFCIIFRREII